MSHLFSERKTIFNAFLATQPPRLSDAEAEPAKKAKTPIRVVDRNLFSRLVTVYEEQWRNYYLPQLLEWKMDPISELDPALYRGDELQLFRPHHEVDYSNWLSWLLLESNPAADLLQKTVLISMCPDLEGTVLPVFEIEREFGVRQGHDEHSGSLDFLLLNEEHKLLFVIENKTRTPTDDELKKHKGYRQSIEDAFPDYPAKRFILLVPDVEQVNSKVNAEYGDFELAEWSSLSKALRAVLMSRKLSGDVRNEVFTGLFIAAIEGYIIGYPVAAWRRLLRYETDQPEGDIALLAKVVASSGYHNYLEEFYAQNQG